MAKPSPCIGWQYATRAEERNSPEREVKVSRSLGSHLRTLMTRAPRSLTFSVNVDSAPGTCRLPSRYTPISMGMRRSVRWKGKALLRGEFMIRSSSQARSDAREILDTAAAMLHAVKSTVGGGQQLFGRVAVFRKRRRAGARGKRR